jgi:DNA polymerase III alpha subunit (gram-positive type)
VAHAISFDYKFISATMEQFDLGKLCNRKLCTIDLAKRSFSNDKYGLEYLRKLLNINTSNVFNVLYGLGKNYNKEYLKKLNKLKKTDLMATVEKYFNPDNFTYAIISSKE